MITFFTQSGAIVNATDFETISAEPLDATECKILLDNKYVLGYHNNDDTLTILKWIFNELGKTRKVRENVNFVMPKESANEDKTEQTD
jgi:hypothetical protein